MFGTVKFRRIVSTVFDLLNPYSVRSHNTHACSKYICVFFYFIKAAAKHFNCRGFRAGLRLKSPTSEPTGTVTSHELPLAQTKPPSLCSLVLEGELFFPPRPADA